MTITILSKIVHGVSPYLPPGLLLAVATGFIAKGKYMTAWRHEFVGTLLMISCTFSAGKWFGVDSTPVAWLSHAVGVIAADYIGGGPHVNPAVSVSMFTLGKVDYTEMYVRIAGQMAGGLISFPIYHYLSVTAGLTPFGGPDFNKIDDDEGIDAAFNEFVATVLLCFLIYTVNWECNFGKYHYWIKQPLTAVGIRYLIEMFPKSGPAMNPMLGTCWAVFNADSNVFPEEASHYLVYWVSPFVAAVFASWWYVLYAGGTLFGATIPFGPIKGAAEPAAATAAATKKKKAT